MTSAGIWVKNLRKDGYSLLVDALVRQRIPPKPFGAAAIAEMHARVGKRYSPALSTVKPRDLQAASVRFADEGQSSAMSQTVNPPVAAYTVQSPSRPTSKIDPTLLGGAFPEIFGTQKRRRFSSPTTTSSRPSHHSEPCESSPPPSSENSSANSPTQPAANGPPSHIHGLTHGERQALQRIATKMFGASVFTAQDHTIRRLDPAVAGLDGDPSVSSLIALEMHTFKSQHRLPTYTVLQQLLRQDLGLWALAALALDDYRLLAVAVPSMLDLCCKWKDEGTAIQVSASGQHPAHYFWLGANIDFIARGDGFHWDVVRKAPLGTYFGQTPQGLLKWRSTRGLQPVPGVTQLNPISQALVGKADWEDAAVSGFVSMLFEISTDDDALGYQVGMYARSAAILAFEGSWLSVLAVAHQEPKTCVANLLNKVLATGETCIHDDEVSKIRTLARRYGIGD
jgi:hypothetical protein